MNAPASRLCVASVLVAAALATTCRAPEPAAPKTPRTLKVVMLPYSSFAPLIVAKERGFFERQGLDIEWVRLERSPESLPSLSQGRLDVVAGGLSAGLVNMVSQGAPIRLVANKGMIPAAGCTGAVSLVGRKGLAPLPGSLRGARVSVQSLLFTELFLDRALEKYGIPQDQITRVDLPAPAILEALQKGLVDFAVTSEPRPTLGRRDGITGPVLDASAVLPNFDHGFILFGPNLLSEDPEAGRRFLVGYIEGVRAFREGKTPENVKVLAQAMQLEEGLLRDTCWMPLRDDLVVDVDSVKQFVEWTRKRGLLEGNPSAEQMIDIAPLRAASGRVR